MDEARRRPFRMSAMRSRHMLAHRGVQAALVGAHVTRDALAAVEHFALEKWMPAYRDDESNERFYGPRYDTRPPHRRQHRFVVCGQCLIEDSVPYLRRSWLIGWTAICPRHQCLLTTHCGACRRKLSGEITAFGRPFAIGCCSMCGSKLSEVPVDVVPAHPTVQRLHDVLLHGKKEGFTVIAGIGRFTGKKSLL